MKRKLFDAAVVATVLVSMALVGAGAQNKNSVPALVDVLFKQLTRIEDDRQGPNYADIRGRSILVNEFNPSIQFLHPLDGQVLDVESDIVIRAAIDNWTVDPSQARNAATEFASGFQRAQVGHTHVWIYDVNTGERVRFTGATGLLYSGEGNVHVSQPFALPVGDYKAYTSCQNDDHTVATQTNAQSLPPVDAVYFKVREL